MTGRSARAILVGVAGALAGCGVIFDLSNHDTSDTSDASDASDGASDSSPGADAPDAPDEVSVPCPTLDDPEAGIVGCIPKGDGIFVSPLGNDASDGTRDAPVKTFERALARARLTAKQIVYACGDGDHVYASTTLTDFPGRLGIYGGFSCGDWIHGRGTTVIKATPPAMALVVRGLPGPLVMADVTLVTDDAPAGGSSVAGFFDDVGEVLVRRVSVSAGIGGAAGPTPATASNACTSFVDASNPLGGSCSCSRYGMSVGGKGGVSGTAGTSGVCSPGNGCGTGGGGGSSMVCGPGGAGANGKALDGGAGNPSFGAITDAGWLLTTGDPGSTGGPGQGGGGGGPPASPNVGGGGGSGGCGGGGGAGGAQGGASIGLLLRNAHVRFEVAKVVTARAGDGVQGGNGLVGQGGYLGVAGQNCGGVGGGGAGGAGAGGSGGAGGNGGVSYGIAFTGDASVTWNGEADAAAWIDASVFGIVTGLPGRAASGGSGAPTTGPSGAGNPGTPGNEPARRAILRVP